MSGPLGQLCINIVRFLSVDAVQRANSGHPGLPLGAAAMAYVLWTRLLKHNPRNPDWFERDRFVLSAGHGSMLLYSLLHLTGYALSLDDIKQFRQWGGKSPGHPERISAVPVLDAEGRSALVGAAVFSSKSTPRKENHPAGLTRCKEVLYATRHDRIGAHGRRSGATPG